MDLSAVWISLKTATVSIAITFVLGTLAAWGVVSLRGRRARAVIDGLLTLPMVLPPTVAGFFLLLLLGVNRPLGRFLQQVLSVKIVFGWGATVVAAVVISFPLMYRSARGAFEQVDITLLRAARSLGMSEARILLRVLLPLSMPGLISGGVLAFARGMGEFGATAMIAGNIAGRTRTLPLAVYSAVAAGNMEEAYGYVAILLCISFLVVVSLNALYAIRPRRSARS